MKFKVKSLICVHVFMLLCFTGARIVSVKADESPSEYSSGYIEDDYEAILDKRPANLPTAYDLPDAVDNTGYYPVPDTQGRQGSCTAWAVSYLKYAQDRRDPGCPVYENGSFFSPAFIYNQSNFGKESRTDGGSSIEAALDIVKNQGVCLLNEMPYNQRDFLTEPNDSQREAARPHQAQDVVYLYSIAEIKKAIMENQGALTAIVANEELANLGRYGNDAIYDTAYSSEANPTWHAICLVGYDNSTGLFKFINSWDTDWGENGYGYIREELVLQKPAAFTMTDLDELEPPAGLVKHFQLHPNWDMMYASDTGENPLPLGQEGTAPYFKDEHMMVPLRPLIEHMGGTVVLDEEADPGWKKIICKINGSTALLWVGLDRLFINATEYHFDVNPEIVNGTTMVQARTFFEALGCKVEYKPFDHEYYNEVIIITY